MTSILHGLKPHLLWGHDSTRIRYKRGKTNVLREALRFSWLCKYVLLCWKLSLWQWHLYIQQDCITIHITQSVLLGFVLISSVQTTELRVRTLNPILSWALFTRSLTNFQSVPPLQFYWRQRFSTGIVIYHN